MNKKIILSVILIFAFVLAVYYFVPFVKSTEYTKTKNPPGKGNWEYVGRCANGAYEWECKGTCENDKEKREREPREHPPKPTPTPTPTPTPAPPNQGLTPNPLWQSVNGYTNSFNDCNSLCQAYQASNCDPQAAVKYCREIVGVDFNRNGDISASEISKTLTGTKNCETNARCYDIIDNCNCKNQPLNFGSCISLFYELYAQTGMSTTEALQTISQNTAGNCQSAGI